MTCAAFRAGELSVDQVAVVARHTPTAYDAEVAGFAQAATVSQLRRTLRTYPSGPRPRTRTRWSARTRPRSAAGTTTPGAGGCAPRLEPDDGAIVDAALREARDALFHAGHPDVTWADALVEVAHRSLGGPPRGPAGRVRGLPPRPRRRWRRTCITVPPCPTACAARSCATPAAWWSASATAARSTWAAPDASSPTTPAG